MSKTRGIARILRALGVQRNADGHLYAARPRPNLTRDGRSAPLLAEIARFVSAAALAAAAPAVGTRAVEEESETFPFSIVGLPVREGRYVDRFAIETWGVNVLAVSAAARLVRTRRPKRGARRGHEGEATHGVRAY